MNGDAAYQAKSEAVPPHAGPGYIGCPLGKLWDSPSRQGGMFYSLPNRTHSFPGWVGCNPPSGTYRNT